MFSTTISNADYIHSTDRNPIFAMQQLFSAWQVAHDAYARVLQEGIGRNDKELSRDVNYRTLVAAGNKLHHFGGQDAVIAASQTLGKRVQGASAEHFERLWFGLLPAAPDDGYRARA